MCITGTHKGHPYHSNTTIQSHTVGAIPCGCPIYIINFVCTAGTHEGHPYPSSIAHRWRNPYHSNTTIQSHTVGAIPCGCPLIQSTYKISVITPLQSIKLNIFRYFQICHFITDNMLIIITLPKILIKSWPTTLLHFLNIFIRR